MSFWKKENVVNTSDKLEGQITFDNLPATQNENTAIQNKQDITTNVVRSALGAGTVIQGKLSFDTPVSIDGKLNGELFSSETVIIGKSGVVEATITVRSIVIYGKVMGNIKAVDKVTILNGAIVEGNISSQSITVEEGAILNCKFEMKQK